MLNFELIVLFLNEKVMLVKKKRTKRSAEMKKIRNKNMTYLFNVLRSEYIQIKQNTKCFFENSKIDFIHFRERIGPRVVFIHSFIHFINFREWIALVVFIHSYILLILENG